MSPPWVGLGAGSRAQEQARRPWCKTPSRRALSRVAAPLLPYCLYAACSKAWTPCVMCMPLLKCWGRDCRSRTLTDRPTQVAVVWCGSGGVKATPLCSQCGSPESGFALLHSILLGAAAALGRGWSRLDQRPRAHHCC